MYKLLLYAVSNIMLPLYVIKQCELYEIRIYYYKTRTHLISCDNVNV